MKPTPKVVSLTHELLHLADLVGSARILSELLANGGLRNEATALEAPSTIAATLAQVQNRLRLIGRVVSGNSNPEVLWTPQNDTGAPARPWEDADVRLAAWEEPLQSQNMTVPAPAAGKPRR